MEALPAGVLWRGAIRKLALQHQIAKRTLSQKPLNKHLRTVHKRLINGGLNLATEQAYTFAWIQPLLILFIHTRYE